MREEFSIEEIEDAIASIGRPPAHDTLIIQPIVHKKGLIERILYRFGYIKGSTKARIYKMDSSKFNFPYPFKKFNEL